MYCHLYYMGSVNVQELSVENVGSGFPVEPPGISRRFQTPSTDHGIWGECGGGCSHKHRPRPCLPSTARQLQRMENSATLADLGPRKIPSPSTVVPNRQS